TPSNYDSYDLPATGSVIRNRRVLLAIAAVYMLGSALATSTGRLQAQVPDPPPTADFVPGELIVRLRNGASAARIETLLVRLGATDAKGFQSVDGLYVITLPSNLSVSAARRLAK